MTEVHTTINVRKFLPSTAGSFRVVRKMMRRLDEADTEEDAKHILREGFDELLALGPDENKNWVTAAKAAGILAEYTPKGLR